MSLSEQARRASSIVVATSTPEGLRLARLEVLETLKGPAFPEIFARVDGSNCDFWPSWKGARGGLYLVFLDAEQKSIDGAESYVALAPRHRLGGARLVEATRQFINSGYGATQGAILDAELAAPLRTLNAVLGALRP